MTSLICRIKNALKITRSLWGIALLLLPLGLGVCKKTGAEGLGGSLSIDRESRSLTFAGTIHPRRYNQYRDRQCGHHFIVWSGGSNSRKALINTDVPDEKILDALLQLGAKPGDNLSEDAWNERNNPNSPESDRRVKGSKVEVFVAWEGKEHPALELFQSLQPEEMDLGVGGHRDLIPVWRSGCVTCLFSCPGGRTSNAAYTIRDQAQKRKTFLAKETDLPEDGTNVTVRMKVGE